MEPNCYCQCINPIVNMVCFFIFVGIFIWGIYLFYITHIKED